MLDALRSNYVLQTSADMSGFHEGFSDLMALFHHFLHKDALRNALALCRGNLRDSKYLSHIGQQFGRASGGGAALRSACNTELRYDPKMPAHQMGELLMAAVFDAFCTVYERKTAAIMRLATRGTGRLAEGDLPDALVEALTTRAHNLASQFLNMLIRAVDYLPPVDVRLGEYLRAIITADSELVPDDTWNYREALIDAFRLRGVYPREVVSLNEDSLLCGLPVARSRRSSRCRSRRSTSRAIRAGRDAGIHCARAYPRPAARHLRRRHHRHPVGGRLYQRGEMLAALAEKKDGKSVFTEFMGQPEPFAPEVIENGALRKVLQTSTSRLCQTP